MKRIVFCLSLLIAGAAGADELADANALFAKKAFPEALQKYTRLANAGKEPRSAERSQATATESPC